MIRRQFYLFLFYHVVCNAIIHANAYRLIVELTNNGPAVLDANITFTAKLSLPSGVTPTGPFYCTFSDTLDGYYTTQTSEATVFNLTLNYPSSKYRKGTYRMDVTVYKQEFIFPIPQGSSSSFFNLTEILNGHIVPQQNSTNQHLKPNYVATNEETRFAVKFHDPEHFLEQAQDIVYYWFVDDIPYGTSKDPVFKYNFTEADKLHTVMVDVYASYAEPTTTTTSTTTTTTSTTTTTTPATTTSTSTTTTPTTTTTTPTTTTTMLPSSTTLGTSSHRSIDDTKQRRRRSVIHYERFIGYKVALFSVDVIARAPIQNVTIRGNNWLKHGDIMNMNISCNGSKPFYYCWAYDGFINQTTNASCELPIKTTDCKILLLHYFSTPGEHHLPVVLFNDVSYQVIPLKINIYEADRKAQLSLVVVPIASACVAIITIAFGIGLYFYTRRNLRIEVADFDFEQEEAPEMTFFGRLKSAVIEYWTGLRYPQHLPGNYQNITFD